MQGRDYQGSQSSLISDLRVSLVRDYRVMNPQFGPVRVAVIGEVMLARLQWAECGLQAGIEVDNEDRIAAGLRSVLYNFTNDALDFQVADLSAAGDVELLDGPGGRVNIRHAGARNL